MIHECTRREKEIGEEKEEETLFPSDRQADFHADELSGWCRLALVQGLVQRDEVSLRAIGFFMIYGRCVESYLPRRSYWRDSDACLRCPSDCNMVIPCHVKSPSLIICPSSRRLCATWRLPILMEILKLWHVRYFLIWKVRFAASNNFLFFQFLEFCNLRWSNIFSNFFLSKLVRIIIRDICYHANATLNRDIISSNWLGLLLYRNYEFFRFYNCVLEWSCIACTINWSVIRELTCFEQRIRNAFS